jgi:hypothetical protein
MDSTYTEGGAWATPTAWSANLYIGCAAAGDSQLNGAICEFETFAVELTAVEIAALWNKGKALTDYGATDSPGIYILDGKFRIASSTSGARIEIIPEEIAGYNGATKQFYLSAVDGKAMCGAGVDILDASGIGILCSTAYSDQRSFQFRKSDGSVISRLSGYYDAGTTFHQLQLLVASEVGQNSKLEVEVASPAGKVAGWDLRAYHGAGSLAQVYATVGSDNVSSIYIDIDAATRIIVTAGSDGGGIADVQFSGEIGGTGNNSFVVVESGTGGTGGVRPDQAGGSGYLGTSTYYWNEIHYKTLVDDGCLIDIGDVVDLKDGRKLSPRNALKEIRVHPDKISPRTGKHQLDYASFPALAFNEGETAQDDVIEDGKTKWKKGEKSGQDGIEIGTLLSVILAAINELSAEVDDLKGKP